MSYGDAFIPPCQDCSEDQNIQSSQANVSSSCLLHRRVSVMFSIHLAEFLSIFLKKKKKNHRIIVKRDQVC